MYLKYDLASVNTVQARICWKMGLSVADYHMSVSGCKPLAQDVRKC